jgi:hypothetical protein
MLQKLWHLTEEYFGTLNKYSLPNQLDRLSRGENDLVMVMLLPTLTKVLLRVSIKGLLAACRTEVIGLSFIL